MELYYNPEQMPDSEIKQTFVARQWLIDELLSMIERQPDGAGVQHAIIIGPRGIGKTTMLLMLRLAVLEGELGQRWFPVRFPEESYSVSDLADFWLAAISHLAFESGDASLVETADNLKQESKDGTTLAEGAVAMLKDWLRRRKRRLLLLVDNLDMMLDQIGDATENARLRDVLMNDGTFMLVGGATSFFKEARRYDQPLYNFFRTYNLDLLNPEQVNDLLRHRAAADKQEGFDELLKKNEARIKVLQYFTGGNPRLVLMLYRIVSSSDFGDVRRGLEKLLDEVTPYYKAKIESLPAQQRKILDHIARISGKTQEGLTPTQIAQETRLPANQVSAQLKRLADLGYVRTANIRSRNSYYSLAEPLYAIWHQMRFGRESRKRMEWLVEFLKHWYTSREIVEQTERLAAGFADLMKIGTIGAALENWDYRYYLSDAMETDVRSSAVDRLVCDALDANQLERVRDMVRDTDLLCFADPTLHRLKNAGVINEEQQAQLLKRIGEMWDDLIRVTSGDPQDTLDVVDGMKVIFHIIPGLWFVRAAALFRLYRFGEALDDLDNVISRVSNDHALKNDICALRTLSLFCLGRFEEAASSAEAIKSDERRILDLSEVIVTITKEFATTDGLQFLIECHAFDAARRFWRHVVNDAREQQDISKLATEVAGMAKPDNIAFLRELIQESNLGETFVQVSRALECIATGDRSVIEKLSAEVRPIAEEIVARYEEKYRAARRPSPERAKRTRRPLPLSIT
jgi:DNA-binding transcriptional ArsR family regulator